MTKMTMVTTMKSWTIYWKSISRLCVKRRMHSALGGENDDLINQEGMIGLFKAIRDYKSDKEASFYSFAQLCITRQLSSALEASNRKKHMPLKAHIYPFRRVTVMVQSLRKCCKMILQVLSSFS